MWLFVETLDGVNDWISIMTDVLMIISIVGAFITILTFLVFSSIRTDPIRLIMYLCVCIIFGFTFFMVSFNDDVIDSSFCIGAAVLTHFFFIANFCWTFCIAFNFYQMIVRRNREANELEKWYHLLSWGVPGVLCIAVGASGNYGELGTEDDLCYIDSDLARFLAFFLPGLVVISVNSVLFFFIGREIHETLSSAPKSQEDSKNTRKEFRVYISIFISIGLSWIFGYLMFIIPDETAATVFLVLFSIFTPLQGFLIFFSYCVNKKVGAKWAGLFGNVCPCCNDLRDRLSQQTTTGSRSSSRSASSRASSRSADSSSASSRL